MCDRICFLRVPPANFVEVVGAHFEANLIDSFSLAITTKQLTFPSLRFQRHQTIVLAFQMLDDKPGRLQRQKDKVALFDRGIGR